MMTIRARFATTLSLLFLATAAHAATIVVTAVTDDLDPNGNCTLREAVQAANSDSPVDACSAGSGADVIELAAGDYVLGIANVGTGEFADREDENLRGDFDLASEIEIAGEDATTTSIHGAELDRILHVLPGAILTIHDVTLRKGRLGNYDGLFVGGAIAVEGMATVERCQLLDNFAPSMGGAIGIWEGSAVVRDCTFRGNNAIVNGGSAIKAVGVYADAELLLERSTFDANINLFGLNMVIDIESWADRSVLATINSVTISNNFGAPTQYGPTGAGGVLVRHFNPEAGGIAHADLNNVTITDNAYPAVWAEYGAARIDVSNSVLTSSGRPEPDCFWNVHSGGHNIVGLLLEVDQPEWVCDFDEDLGDQIVSDPRLFPLEHNGGATRTRKPRPFSVTRNAGSPLTPGSGDGACEALDQRGVAREVCDVGAFQESAVSQCPLTATSDCRATAAAKFQLKDKDANGPGSGDRLQWSWKEPTTTRSDLGEPDTSTLYTICIYENGGATLFASASLLAGGLCGASPCWDWQVDGYRFSDRRARLDGIRSLSVEAGDLPGQAKARIQGRNGELQFSSLPVDGDLRVQLLRSDSTICWESSFPAASMDKNTADRVLSRQ